jgi:hypothetical protein
MHVNDEYHHWILNGLYQVHDFLSFTFICVDDMLQIVELINAGFVDSYRYVYPDVVAHPGFTWTPWTHWQPIRHDEVHDRIDYLYFRSSSQSPTASTSTPSNTLESKSLPASSSSVPAVLASSEMHLIIKPVSMTIHDTIPGGGHWPSDHRALSTIFHWSPSLGNKAPLGAVLPQPLVDSTPSSSYWKLVTEGKGTSIDPRLII